jgi:hypothetical protein
MWKRFHIKYPLFSSDFNKTLFSQHIFKKTSQVSSFIKIRPVEAGLQHATDGQKDMTKLIVAFLNFASAPKKQFQSCFKQYQ